MSYMEQNRQALIEYFRAGAKPASRCGALGVEVEHFVVHEGSLAPVPYEANGEATGGLPAGEAPGGEGADGFCVREVLEALAAHYPEQARGTHGELIGLASAEASITLEPAAQLEISIAPFSSIAQIMRVYGEFRAQVDPLLAAHGCLLVAQGYHPSARALDLQLIPKQRYGFMDAYFHNLGTHGMRMMRASSSTQVSIDYSSEADAVRKMRVAQALAPVLASITDNVSRFEGKPPAAPLARLRLWRDVDNARCGCVPGIFDKGFGFEAYADWVLGTCPIFITRPAEGEPDDAPRVRSVSTPDATAAKAYAAIPMQKADIEHLLSMFWPDVRLKSFVEIRPADSLPASLVAGYAALVRGLFYSEASLASIEEALGVQGGVWPLDDESADEAIAAIAGAGAGARAAEGAADDAAKAAAAAGAADAALVYGKPLREWKTLLFRLARTALCPEDAAYLAALERHANEA